MSIHPPAAEKPPLRVLLCTPRGFCAGVVRALDDVARALKKYGAPVYVRHEIVHNKYVSSRCGKKARCSSRIRRSADATIW